MYDLLFSFILIIIYIFVYICNQEQTIVQGYKNPSISHQGNTTGTPANQTGTLENGSYLLHKEGGTLENGSHVSNREAEILKKITYDTLGNQGGDGKYSLSGNNSPLKQTNDTISGKLTNEAMKISLKGSRNDGTHPGMEIKKYGSESKVECPKKTILRLGWNNPNVQHGFNISCGDMDFIKTIEAESKWDPKALGDSDKSYGFCQIHRYYNYEKQMQYRKLSTDLERVELCYAMYSEWVANGKISKRLYGYNVRNLKQNDSFTFNE